VKTKRQEAAALKKSPNLRKLRPTGFRQIFNEQWGKETIKREEIPEAGDKWAASQTVQETKARGKARRISVRAPKEKRPAGT